MLPITTAKSSICSAIRRTFWGGLILQFWGNRKCESDKKREGTEGGVFMLHYYGGQGI